MRVNSSTVYFTNQAISTATVASAPLNVVHCLNFCVQVDTASSAGLNATFKLQGRVGQRAWADIAGASQTVTGDGSVVFNQSNVGYDAARLVMTVTAGTSTATAEFRKKEPSA